jgi:hypothetical protein
MAETEHMRMQRKTNESAKAAARSAESTARSANYAAAMAEQSRDDQARHNAAVEQVNAQRVSELRAQSAEMEAQTQLATKQVALQQAAYESQLEIEDETRRHHFAIWRQTNEGLHYLEWQHKAWLAVGLVDERNAQWDELYHSLLAGLMDEAERDAATIDSDVRMHIDEELPSWKRAHELKAIQESIKSGDFEFPTEPSRPQSQENPTTTGPVRGRKKAANAAVGLSVVTAGLSIVFGLTALISWPFGANQWATPLFLAALGSALAFFIAFMILEPNLTGTAEEQEETSQYERARKAYKQEVKVLNHLDAELAAARAQLERDRTGHEGAIHEAEVATSRNELLVEKWGFDPLAEGALASTLRRHWTQAPDAHSMAESLRTFMTQAQRFPPAIGEYPALSIPSVIDKDYLENPAQAQLAVELAIENASLVGDFASSAAGR